MEENTGPTHLLGRWRFSALLAIVIITAIGYFLFTLWAGWEPVSFAFKEIGFFGTLVPMGLALIAYFLRFMRWNRFLRVLGHPVPFFKSLRIYIGGFAFSVTPGKTGEALRSVFLKDFGVPYRQSFGAFLAERFSDVMAVFLLATGGLLCCPDTRPMMFLALAFVTLILALIQSEKFLRSIERGCKKLLPESFAIHIEFVLETVLSFRKCFNLFTLIYAIAIGMLAWGLEALGCFILLKLLHVDITFFNVLFIYSFSLLVGAMTFLPAGLGGAEITLIQLLILYQVPSPIAVAVTIAIRLTTLWWSVFLGILFLPRGQLKN